MKCMTCKEEFAKGALGIPVHMFVPDQDRIVPIKVARGFVHVFHIEKASDGLRNVTDHIVSAEDQRSLRDALDHKLVRLVLKSSTRAIYECSCGAAGTATMADHLATNAELNRRAKKNHELHATRAQMKILERVFTPNEMRAHLGLMPK